MQYFFIGLNLMNVFHFSEKRDLCLMKRSIKTHQNLTYLIFFDTKTQVLNFFYIILYAYKNFPLFEFRWNISSSIDLLFLDNDFTINQNQ